MGTPGKASPVKPSTLLDVHEVEWITRELERLLATDVASDAGVAAVHHHRRRRLLLKSAKVIPPANGQKPHAEKGGFLAELIGKHAASICGDDTATVIVRRRRGCRSRSFREVDKS